MDGGDELLHAKTTDLALKLDGSERSLWKNAIAEAVQRTPK